MTEKTFFPLSAITNRIQQILGPHTKKRFWVKAEISSGRERGGSFYCDLVETDKDGGIIAKMRCSIWNRDLNSIRRQFKECDLNLKLEDGTSVGFECLLQYNPKFGLSLKVVGADPAFALGELELKKKEILDRLTKEGLLEPNKKVIVPMLPQKIGLISSKGSAAYNDVLQTLNSAPFGFKIYMADATVQGDKTEQLVLNALGTLAKLDLDLVILVRGGGSKTDLSYLDNEAIARQIASYRFPVWTGIGHETDISILDHVANRYFKTPTAVAEEIVARFIEMARHIEEAKDRFRLSWAYRLETSKNWIADAKTGMRQGTRKLLDTTRSNLENLANFLRAKVTDRLGSENTRLSVSRKTLLTAPLTTFVLFRERMGSKKQKYIYYCSRQLVEERKNLENLRKRFHPDRFNQRIDRENDHVKNWVGQFSRKFNNEFNIRMQNLVYLRNRFRVETVLARIENEKRLIENILVTLRAVDPETSLKRGFSLVYKEDGELVKSIAQVNMNGMLKTDLSDGQVSSTVISIEEK